MKIEYEQSGAGVWVANHNSQKIGGIATLISEESESGFKVVAIQYNTHEPTPIPGSPFETVNQAKAALEYHFRNLTETE